MRYLLLILLLLLIIGSSLIQKTNIPSNSSDRITKIINTLIRQTSRWSAAAQQDDSPIIALLHANYGAGYLWALKDIASDQEITERTGLDIIKFKKKITDIQDAATRNVSKKCPQFTGDIDKFLLELGGDV